MRNGLYISVLIIILLSGCKKENLIDGNPKAVNTNFTLVPAEFGSITTRAGVAVDENNVINLWILQFDGTTDASILVRSEYKASIGNLAELQIVLNQGVNHRVLFIANTFDYLMRQMHRLTPLHIYNSNRKHSRCQTNQGCSPEGLQNI